MAFIDCASWKPQSDEFVFAYRYPETNLSTFTQLIVAESQEAFLFSKGQMMDKFGPGKHTLNSENIPILPGCMVFLLEETTHLLPKCGLSTSYIQPI